MKLLSKVFLLQNKKKIITGVAVAGSLGLLYLFLKDRFGFGTPVEQWQKTRLPVRSKIANNRGEARDLQSVARTRRDWAINKAETKQGKQDVAVAAEGRRREAIWRRARKQIENN